MTDYDIQTEMSLLLDESVRVLGQTLSELGDLQDAGLIAFKGEEGLAFCDKRRARWAHTYRALRDRYNRLVETMQERNNALR